MRRLAAAFILGALASAFASAAGQPGSSASRCAERQVAERAPRTPPLDRMVVVFARDVSLRDALDRLGAAAGIRLSYSNDFLPLDRRVCLAPVRMTVGAALDALLDSVNVDPLVAASDQIVLAPSRNRLAVASPVSSNGVGMLERVVVTGSATGEAQRPLTVALDIVPASQARATDGSLAQMLGTLPGLWLSGQSPSALLTRYGSVRGASSFGLSYPKMYIDGIEVANPLLVTELDPATLDHVEIIRGPQGAALYGADAISGVVNVITRHSGADAPGGPIQITSTGGWSQSAFATRPVLEQQHGALINVGSNLRSGSLSVSGSTMGDFTPNSASSQLQAGGAMRMIGARTSLSAAARFFAKTANVAPNPLLASLVPPIATDTSKRARMTRDPNDRHTESVFARPVADSSPQSVREYTVGVTGAFLQSDRWTHTLVAGIDGYQLSNLPNDFTPVPSSADSALRAARGAAARGSVRASSVGQFGSNERTLKVTVAAEQSTLRENTNVDDEPHVPGTPLQQHAVVAWTNNVGLVTQLDAGFYNTLFITGGIREERTSGAGSITSSLLPMLGAAWVKDLGPVTAKLRSAYGKASRPPESAARQTTWLGVHTSPGTTLQPEEQSGIEVGTDVLAGNVFSLHVTRFDQRASGLIQPVAVVGDTMSTSGPPVQHLAYALQNVGEIGNHGWELESSVGVRQLSFNGSLSFVDSRVRRLANGYKGDLRPGDRMLGVPARTGSVASTWTADAWWATITVSRASDWINYNRLALASAASDPNERAQNLVGPTLRSYWVRYDGVTRINAAASRDVFRNVALTVRASNLLNEQVGDPDNVTVLPGRSFLAGIKARF